MNTITETMQAGTQAVFTQYGRKGIAYDWQSLYAAAEAATLDHQLAALVPAHAK